MDVVGFCLGEGAPYRVLLQTPNRGRTEKLHVYYYRFTWTATS